MTRIAILAVCSAAAVLAACGSDDEETLPGPPPLAKTALGAYKFDDPKVGEDADTARRATGRYQSDREALADGYQPPPGRTPRCSNPSGKGNGGVEYVNAALVEDPKVDLRRPEVLLYGPLEGGGRKLLAVQYRPGGGQQATLFGQQVSGPLTVWLWLFNPDGILEPGNVNSQCEPGPIPDIPESKSTGGGPPGEGGPPGGGGGGPPEDQGGQPEG